LLITSRDGLNQGEAPGEVVTARPETLVATA